jgi:signal transduction histidine kinase
MKPLFFIVGFLLFNHLAFSQLQEIRALQRTLPSMKEGTEKTDVLNRLAQLMAERRPDSSYSYLKIARTMADQLNYNKGMAMAYKTSGALLSGNNNYLAATYLNNAIDKFKAIEDKEGESMALMNMANLMYLDGDSTNAHTWLVKSYQMTLILAKDSVRSIIMNNLNMHSPNYLAPQVNTLYQQGSAIAKKYKDDRMMLYFKLFESNRLWDSGSHDKSVRLLKSALKTADSIGNNVLKLSIYFELGNEFEAIDTTNSRTYYQKGLKEAATYRFTTYKVLFAKSLYNYFKTRHQDKEAILYANMMLEAQQKHQEELRKYGFNVVNYVSKDRDLKVIQERERTGILVTVVFMALLITAVALLFFVFRSFRISKRYAAIQQKLSKETHARNKELENWNKFYDTLLSVFAHDLRQPFSSIIMTSQLLEIADDTFSKTELKTIVLDLYDTASKSMDLLEGLLYWVKSKKESFEYTTYPLLLHDNIAEANGLYAKEQQNKQVTLLNEVPEELVVQAHQQMLLFINRNLISNATKYSPEGGTIRIYSKIRNGETIVAFSDQGPGMTPQQAERLFSIVETNDNEGTHIKGAGIALSICYDMIRQMHGRLWVETKPGEGTLFFYALPVKDLIQL